ncbi:aminoacyl-tRNA hydrolase [Hoyosella altamirensis]|uniref:Peptidyl-tRNA hydrolase n=1 Tax=Hoyosella altamirensis TaxID=616997 RepID=A0A839RII2_9ACTN|nr:aminoacyl-tRNA hydrolase [Hoyosella altamirensis]MBB3035956.1 PTH1 family peptidyl-tRNA hydrolase [Hoyosella altamirensis]
MTFVVAGLGNPGTQYATTRHNVGYLVADVLATRYGARFSRQKRTRADLAEIRLSGVNAVLAKPHTYMNLSGGPISATAKFFSVPPENVIAVHDDLDLDFGVVRLKRGGGEGGHNGLRSLTSHLHTRDYLRVRLGVGRPPGQMAAASYVLKPFSATERKELGVIVEEAADALELLIELGLEAAQNRVHAR